MKNVAYMLEQIRFDKQVTKRGAILCGYAMAESLKLGWDKSALDALEIIWWGVHDGNGELIKQNESEQPPGLV